MKRGLYERPGVSATAWAAAWARRLEEAATKVSKVNFESSWTAGRFPPAPGPGTEIGIGVGSVVPPASPHRLHPIPACRRRARSGQSSARPAPARRPPRPRRPPRSRGRAARSIEAGGSDRSGLVDLEPAPHGRAHLVGQRVLDHREVSGLHPLPDQPVGHSQDKYPVVEVRRARSPRATVATWSPTPARAATLCTVSRDLQPDSPLSRSPLLPPRRPATCSERPSVRVIGRTYTAAPRCD